MSAPARLDVMGLGVTIGAKPILRDVSLSLAGARIVALIGPNGAGKSTLLGALAGLRPSVTQRLSLDGAALTGAAVSYLPQAHQVSAALSVTEVVLLGQHEHLGWRVGAAPLERADQMLADFDLGDLADRPMTTLSGGQQQMVLLAQRLMRAPRLLLLDEPTSALDLHHQLAMLKQLNAYAERSGALVLAALHDLNLVAQHCDHVVLMDEGRLAAVGAPGEVLTRAVIAAAYRIDVEIIERPGGGRLIVPLSPLSDANRRLGAA